MFVSDIAERGHPLPWHLVGATISDPPAWFRTLEEAVPWGVITPPRYASDGHRLGLADLVKHKLPDLLPLPELEDSSIPIFTDGSLDGDHMGFAMVSPFPVPGWERHSDPPFSFVGRRVSLLGEEGFSSSTAELMALVEAAAAPLPLPVVVYSDSGYCLLGLHKLASARQRSVTRSTERPLWLTCQSVLSVREVSITVRKCTSHGKDASQHSGITSWNSS